MVSSIGSGLSSSQALRALNAFKVDEQIVKNQAPEEKKEELSIGNEINTDVLRNDVSQFKANDIKEYATMFDANLTNADINYGTTYGRSVIVDFSA